MSIHASAPFALDGAPTEPTSVYRYYDRNDVLIYVGITKQGMGRNLQHNRKAGWWQYVARQEVDHLPSRPAALAFEKKLIQQHRPPFNRQHNVDSESLRESYCASAEGFMVYESLPAKGKNSRGNPDARLLPLEVAHRSADRVLLKSQADHSPLARLLQLPEEGASVFDVRRSGAASAVIRDLDMVGDCLFLDCEPTDLMPLEVANVRARVRHQPKSMPPLMILQRIFLDASGPVIG